MGPGKQYCPLRLKGYRLAAQMRRPTWSESCIETTHVTLVHEITRFQTLILVPYWSASCRYCPRTWVGTCVYWHFFHKEPNLFSILSTSSYCVLVDERVVLRSTQKVISIPMLKILLPRLCEPMQAIPSLPLLVHTLGLKSSRMNTIRHSS